MAFSVKWHTQTGRTQLKIWWGDEVCQTRCDRACLTTRWYSEFLFFSEFLSKVLQIFYCHRTKRVSFIPQLTHSIVFHVLPFSHHCFSPQDIKTQFHHSVCLYVLRGKKLKGHGVGLELGRRNKRNVVEDTQYKGLTKSCWIWPLCDD